MASPDRALHRPLPADRSDRVVDLRETAYVISIVEVARRLDIPKSTLYGWRYKRIGPPAHRAGKHLRYR